MDSRLLLISYTGPSRQSANEMGQANQGMYLKNDELMQYNLTGHKFTSKTERTSALPTNGLHI